ncbi:hypothetical protein [Streptomyces xantholiticus]|uniref:Uncharacterized protein n=1 Tax=Streptomyces xantholiticus TaxID=68285 RepID=A0ABV1V1C8_9ACTN
MTTADLAPVSALTAAEKAAAAAARSLLPLVAETVRHQFPDAAFLVLTREYDEDELELDSVRTANGKIVWSFRWDHTGYERFPKPVPAELAALWGADDPQDPAPVQDLVQRIDRFARIGFLAPSAMRMGEANADRTPLGIPLVEEPKRCAVCQTPIAEHAGRICPRP